MAICCDRDMPSRLLAKKLSKCGSLVSMLEEVRYFIEVYTAKKELRNFPMTENGFRGRVECVTRCHDDKTDGGRRVQVLMNNLNNLNNLNKHL